MARPRPRRRNTSAQNRHTSALGFRGLGFEPLEPRLALSTFYSFDVIAQTGVTNVSGEKLTGLTSGPSINDSGTVAFVGQATNGSAVFVGNAPGAVVRLSGQSNYSVLGSPQINNSGNVLVTERQTNPFLFNRLSLYDTDQFCPACFDVLASSGELGTSIIAFSSLSNNVDSDTGDGVVFGAIASPGDQPTIRRPDSTGSGLGDFVASYDVPGTTMRPMMADTGDFVYRTRNSILAPIRLVDSSGASTDIASTAHFRELGGAPGISDDGQIVVFYGDLTETGAVAVSAAQPATFFRLTPGPGIFASVATNNGRIVQRIAGIANNGILDVNEIWNDANRNRKVDRGEDNSSAFDEFGKMNSTVQFTSFVPDDRVGVNSVNSTQQGVTIVFSGRGSNDKEGLYASRLNFFTADPKNFNAQMPTAFGVEFPTRLVQVGEPILGSLEPGGVVTDFITYDPVSSRGRGDIAFLVKTDSAEAVMRARPTTAQLGLSVFHPDSAVVQQVIPSPFTYGANVPQQIILHAPIGSEASTISEFLYDTNEPTSEKKSATHYLVSRKGRITQFIPENGFAQHAETLTNNTNAKSIGIELEDNLLSTSVYPFETEPQLRAAAKLIADICRRHDIECEHRREFEGDYYKRLGPSAGGVIQHGQVAGSTKLDPLNWNESNAFAGTVGQEKWDRLMSRVESALTWKLHSPANLLVTDQTGRRVGFDPVSGTTVMEIPGATYSGPGTEPQTLSVPDAASGNYAVKVVGTGTGGYVLDVYGGDQEFGLSESHIAASTAAGQITTFTVAHNAQDARQTAIGGIPTITVSGANVRETDFGDIVVDYVLALSQAPTLPVTVTLTTLDGTATEADGDYVGVNGTITFNPTDPLTRKVSVVIHADLREEEHETFSLYLTDVKNATIGSREAVATIFNDETTISVASVQEPEGNAGPTFFDFIASLSYPTILPVSVDYTTENGTAVTPSDYPLTRGTLTFVPGEQTSQAITVRVKGDLASEAYETFTVELSGEVNATVAPDAASAVGTIVDDDTGGFYYINDSYTVGDVYTTAPGSNLNDGKSPGQPMASLTAFLTKYPALQPGDSIFVDSGQYAISKNIALGPSLSGIRIIGPEGDDLVQVTTGSEVLASRPVAYWRMGSASSGVVPDTSGKGIDLTLTDDARVGEPGVSDDGALVASGKVPVATAALSPLLRPANLSVEMWMKAEVGSLNILGVATGNGGYGFSLYGGKLGFSVGHGSRNGFGPVVLTPAPHDTWTHVVGTYDGSQVRLYLNGALVGSTTYTGGINYAHIGAHLPFGISHENNDEHFSGAIDELAFYDRALTASEIAAHFAAVGFTRATLDRRNATAGTRVFELAGADNVTIANVAMTGADIGVSGGPGTGSNGLTLVGDDIYGNATGGIDVSTSNNGLRMVDSRVHGMITGIAYYGNSGLFLDNSIAHNSSGGFYQCCSVQSLTIENNKFIANGASTIRAAGVGIRIAGNVIVGDGLFGSNAHAGVAVTADDAAVGKNAIVVENNDVSVLTVGISASGWRGLPSLGGTGGAEVIVRDNVVHDNRTGIELQRATASENIVFTNETGISGSGSVFGGFSGTFLAPSTIVGNYIYGNLNEGIVARGADAVSRNIVHSNGTGITGRGGATFPFTGLVDGNVAYGNSLAGIAVAGGNGARVYNNTVLAGVGDAVQVTHYESLASKNTRLLNNILQANSGHAIYVADDSQDGLTSDFNDIFTASTGHVGYFGATFDTLVDWSLELDLDRNSVSAEPKFVHALGPDGILGYVAATGYDGGLDNDFHLRSDSPLIDKGDPASVFSQEPGPNGGRIDLGAYGNSREATGKSQRVSVRAPAEVLLLYEGWSRRTFEVVLAQPPVASVTVQLTTDSQVELSVSSMTFATSDWNVPRIVTIWAKDDAVIEGLHQGKVSFVTASTDAEFQAAVVAPVTADIEDNDVPQSWQNPLDRLDVNADGQIAPNDVVEVINNINAFGSRALPEISVAAAPPPYIDTTGDGHIAPNDALDVIDYINANRPSGSGGEGEAVSGSQEPGARREGPAAAIQEVEAREDEQADLKGARVDAALAESALWLEEFLSTQPTGSRRGRRGWV